VGIGANGDDAGASQNKNNGEGGGDTTKPKNGDVSVNATTTNDEPNSISTTDNPTLTINTTTGTGADKLNGGGDTTPENPMKNGGNAGTDTGSATAATDSGATPKESGKDLLDLGFPLV